MFIYKIQYLPLRIECKYDIIRVIIKEHPICIKRLPNCFFIRWLELHEVVFNEDCCEAGLNLLGFSELFAVSKLDLMNVPIVSNFDLISALNKAAKENL